MTTRKRVALEGEGAMELSARRLGGKLEDICSFIDETYAGELHAKRVRALADATLGVMAGATLAVSMIGQALALARGLLTKHALKQVDRTLSNQGIDVWESFAHWVPQRIGQRREIDDGVHQPQFLGLGGLSHPRRRHGAIELGVREVPALLELRPHLAV